MSIYLSKEQAKVSDLEHTLDFRILKLHDHIIKIKLVCSSDDKNLISYRVINTQKNSDGEYDFVSDAFFSVPLGIENVEVAALCEKQLKNIQEGFSAKFNLPNELKNSELVTQCSLINAKNATHYYEQQIKKYINAHFIEVHSLKEKITTQIDHLKHMFDHDTQSNKMKLKK